MKRNLAIGLAVLGLFAFIGVHTHEKPGRHSGAAYRQKLSGLSIKGGGYRAYPPGRAGNGRDSRPRHAADTASGARAAAAPADGYVLPRRPGPSR